MVIYFETVEHFKTNEHLKNVNYLEIFKHIETVEHLKIIEYVKQNVAPIYIQAIKYIFSPRALTPAFILLVRGMKDNIRKASYLSFIRNIT